MVNCQTCGEEDRFEYIDGSYSCTVCFTHAHELTEFEQEQTAAGAVASQAFTKEVKKKPKERKKERKKNSKRDDGLSWTTTEAFTMVLREQVKSLIALGITDELKDVVFTLYTQYLRRIKEAFVSNEEWETKNKCRTPRDQHCLNRTDGDGERYVIQKASIGRPTPQKCKGKTVTRRSSAYLMKKDFQKSFTFLADADASETDSDGGGGDSWSDNESEIRVIKQEKTVETDPVNKEDVSVNKTSETKQVISLAERRVRLSLIKLVSLCFIALRLLHYHVTMPEMISLIRSHHLPYIKAALLLPGRYKMCGTDKQQWICQGVPSAERLYNTCVMVSGILRISSYPEPQWEVYFSKLLLDLNLPVNLLAKLLKLAELAKLPKQTNSHTLMKYEVVAAGYIVLLLQIMFGLDGNTESFMSQYAEVLEDKLREVGATCFKQVQLFNWSQWVSYIEQISEARQRIDTKVNELFDIRNVDVIKYILDHQSLKINHKSPAYERSIRENFSNIIRTYDNPKDHIKSTSSRPTSFPTRLTATTHSLDVPEFINADTNFILQPNVFLHNVNCILSAGDGNCTKLTLNHLTQVVAQARHEMHEKAKQPDISAFVGRDNMDKSMDMSCQEEETHSTFEEGCSLSNDPFLSLSVEQLILASDETFVNIHDETCKGKDDEYNDIESHEHQQPALVALCQAVTTGTKGNGNASADTGYGNSDSNVGTRYGEISTGTESVHNMCKRSKGGTVAEKSRQKPMPLPGTDADDSDVSLDGSSFDLECMLDCGKSKSLHASRKPLTNSVATTLTELYGACSDNIELLTNATVSDELQQNLNISCDSLNILKPHRHKYPQNDLYWDSKQRRFVKPAKFVETVNRGYVQESVSYKWLMTNISNIVHCSHLTLYHAVIYLQQLIHPSNEDQRAYLLRALYHLDLAQIVVDNKHHKT